jgi:hypothetical protein
MYFVTVVKNLTKTDAHILTPGTYEYVMLCKEELRLQMELRLPLREVILGI